MKQRKGITDWFAAALRGFEDILAHVSSPLLAAGLALGMIDLLTDGKLLLNAPWVLFAWALTQTIGIDIMLPMMTDRTVTTFQRRNVGGGIFYAVMTGALAYVGFLGAMVFSLQQSQGLTEAQALAQVGLTPVVWLFERNALAVLLVLLSGILRKKPEVLSKDEEMRRMAEELELAPMRARYAQMKRRQAVGQMRGLVNMGRSFVAGKDVEEDTPDVQAAEQAEDDGDEPTPMSPRRGLSVQSRLKKMYTPGMSIAALAKAADVHRSTAKKYIEAQAAAQAQSRAG